VIGREFDYRLVAAVSALPDNDAQAALARLTEAELVFPRGVPPEARYLFKHALVQDAIYSSLVRGRRQELHGQIARVLEARRPDIVASAPEVLGHHFTEAGLAREAIAYCSRPAGWPEPDRLTPKRLRISRRGWPWSAACPRGENAPCRSLTCRWRSVPRS
jgi:hypothetical protein